MDELVGLAPLILLIVLMYLFAGLTDELFVHHAFARNCCRFLSVTIWPVALICAGKFSFRQGVVLGLMLAWLAYQSSMALNKSTQQFMPYSVVVTPIWEHILADFKPVSDPHEWRSILKSTALTHEFTVVRQGGGAATTLPIRDRELHAGWHEVGYFDEAMNDEHPPLIFWRRHQTFSTRFGFGEVITEIELEPAGDPPTLFMALHSAYTQNPRGPKYRPGVFGSFDFGLSVPNAWWERVKDRCPAPLRIDAEPYSSSV